MDPNTPCYKGRADEDVMKCIAVINNNLAAAGVPDDKKLYVVCNYVKEGALNTLLKNQRDSASKNKKPVYIEFLDILLKSENT